MVYPRLTYNPLRGASYLLVRKYPNLHYNPLQRASFNVVTKYPNIRYNPLSQASFQVIGKAPDWALRLVDDACEWWETKTGQSVTRPSLWWVLGEPERVTTGGTAYIEHNSITIIEGPNIDDAKYALLHELAHILSRDTQHEPIFWDTVVELYRWAGFSKQEVLGLAGLRSDLDDIRQAIERVWNEEERCEPISPEYYDLLPWLQFTPYEYSFQIEPRGESKLDQVLKKLREGIERIQESAMFREFLITMSRFHQYSYHNQILILLQRPDATLVAGYVTWKDLGRHVKEGEKSIKILAPCLPPKQLKCPLCERQFTERDLRKHLAEEHHLDALDVIEFVRRAKEETLYEPIPPYFKVVYVFDIKQTEGKPLPEFVVPVLSGAPNEELFSKALAHARSRGLEVNFEPKPNLDPGIKGYYSGMLIWVKPDEPRAQQLATLLHELAHYYTESVFKIPKADAETIAESASFVVGAHFGFDSGLTSFPYVALWAKDKKVFQKNLDDIRRVAVRMIESLEKETSQAQPSTLKQEKGSRYPEKSSTEEIELYATTRGFEEDDALRADLEGKQGYKLYAVFERPEYAQEVGRQLQAEGQEVKFVKHISTPETGERPTWEIYAKPSI